MTFSLLRLFIRHYEYNFYLIRRTDSTRDRFSFCTICFEIEKKISIKQFFLFFLIFSYEAFVVDFNLFVTIFAPFVIFSGIHTNVLINFLQLPKNNPFSNFFAKTMLMCFVTYFFIAGYLVEFGLFGSFGCTIKTITKFTCLISCILIVMVIFDLAIIAEMIH